MEAWCPLVRMFGPRCASLLARYAEATSKTSRLSHPSLAQGYWHLRAMKLFHAVQTIYEGLDTERSITTPRRGDAVLFYLLTNFWESIYGCTQHLLAQAAKSSCVHRLNIIASH
jgi:hypothetical protein